MYSIVYRSKAIPAFDHVSIYKMLSAARDFNENHGITGCLLYHKNQFLQLLEGDKNQITHLYEKIMVDHRHENIQTIRANDIDRPIFAKWSMAFHDFGNSLDSSHHKVRKLNQILNGAGVFDKPNAMILDFFKSMNEILFVKN